jgi:hypothetical protein
MTSARRAGQRRRAAHRATRRVLIRQAPAGQSRSCGRSRVSAALFTLREIGAVDFSCKRLPAGVAGQ